jgi:hypothetical protein
MLVETYLTKDQKERQLHLDLNDRCKERGGNSTNHRGVLAQYLDTPIYGRPADLCHACHNDKCSNPKHLYWGTRKENTQDAINNGTFKPVFERMVEKYGYEEACRMNKKNSNPSKAGKAGKGKVLSEEHKSKISANRGGGKPLGWRKNKPE